MNLPNSITVARIAVMPLVACPDVGQLGLTIQLLARGPDERFALIEATPDDPGGAFCTIFQPPLPVIATSPDVGRI